MFEELFTRVRQACKIFHTFVFARSCCSATSAAAGDSRPLEVEPRGACAAFPVGDVGEAAAIVGGVAFTTLPARVVRAELLAEVGADPMGPRPTPTSAPTARLPPLTRETDDADDAAPPAVSPGAPAFELGFAIDAPSRVGAAIWPLAGTMTDDRGDACGDGPIEMWPAANNDADAGDMAERGECATLPPLLPGANERDEATPTLLPTLPTGDCGMEACGEEAPDAGRTMLASTVSVAPPSIFGGSSSGPLPPPRLEVRPLLPAGGCCSEVDSPTRPAAVAFIWERRELCVGARCFWEARDSTNSSSDAEGTAESLAADEVADALATAAVVGAPAAIVAAIAPTAG